MFHWYLPAVLATAMVASIVEAQELPLHAGSLVRFASIDEGAALLGREDAFTRSLSTFDLQARLKTDNPAQASDLLQFASRQVLPWSQEEMELIGRCLESLRARLNNFPPLFPDAVLLIKTTGEEEGGAAYCRQNAIILSRKMLERPAEGLERLLAHELFHILSRHDPDRQRNLYAIVGFQPCGEIRLPASLANRKITNPDAPLLNYLLQLQTENGRISATPLLLANEDAYDPTSNKKFFQYMQFRLLQVEPQGRGWRAASTAMGEPILLDPQKTPSYHEQIGRNTGYIIHPEEVLAENFVHVLFETRDLPSTYIVENLRKMLMQPRGT